MPSVIRKESQLAIYRNEREFPKKSDYEKRGFGGVIYRVLRHQDALANWFSTSERFEVHPEDGKRFEEYWCKINEGVPPTPIMLSNGIEIPDSCYEVRPFCVSEDCSCPPFEVNCKNFSKRAYFVPPSEGVLNVVDASRVEIGFTCKVCSGNQVLPHGHNSAHFPLCDKCCEKLNKILNP